MPEGLVIDHKCRNRLCCNPDHLEAVTQAVNVQRGKQTRLNEKDVIQIRSLLGTMTCRKIAQRFGVKQETISNIKHKRSWTNV